MKRLFTILSLPFLLTLTAKAQTVTFTQHIAPIIYNKCTSCHRPGEIGPMPFTNYGQVAAYAGMIKYVTGIRYMPPWKPDPAYRHFLDENVLTNQEIQQIQQWADNGTPQGNPALEPPLPTFPTGSQLGTPDLVVKMNQKFTHQGNNQDQYQVFVLPTNLPTDKNIAAVEIRPGNKTIAHHSILAMDTTNTATALDAQDPKYGYASFGGFGFNPVETNWAGWTPGNAPRFYPIGMGKKLFKGAKLLLQMHYGPSAVTQQDSSTVNIFYAHNPVYRYVATAPISPMLLVNGPFVIPANQVKTFHAVYQVPIDLSLVSVLPHMHLLGKSWNVYALKPNGDTIKIIKIKDWDFNWQNNYRFPRLLKIPMGSTLHVFGTYDNTVNNPSNPNNPPLPVSWGESTTDEMYLVYFEFVPYLPGDENMVLSDKTVAGTFIKPATKLYPLYPNPVNDKMTVGFSLAKPEKVSLKLLDVNGQTVRELSKDQLFHQGPHSLDFPAENLPAGVYLFRMEAGSFAQTQRLVLIK
jgi:hypothetical protein